MGYATKQKYLWSCRRRSEQLVHKAHYAQVSLYEIVFAWVSLGISVPAFSYISEVCWSVVKVSIFFKGLFQIFPEVPVWKQLSFTSCFWVECCHILFCNLVFMCVRKEKNKNILSLSSFKVDIDSDVPGSADQAVLSSRPEQWPENERREVFLARQSRLGTLVSPQPSNSSRELSGEYIRSNSAWTRFGSVLYSRIFTRTG